MLQSSFTSVLSSALEYSSRLPVSVLVRARSYQPLGAFLGRLSDNFPNINAVEPAAWLMGADLPSPGNLRLSANGILTRFIVTRSGMITCITSRVRYPYSFAGVCNALLPLALASKPAASVTRLSPVHYRRRTPRPVSYYALLK